MKISNIIFTISQNINSVIFRQNDKFTNKLATQVGEGGGVEENYCDRFQWIMALLNGFYFMCVQHYQFDI